MKARYVGTCNLCNKPWDKGAEIGRLLGACVHQACKDERLAQIRSEASPEALPDARGWCDRPRWVTSKEIREDVKRQWHK